MTPAEKQRVRSNIAMNDANLRSQWTTEGDVVTWHAPSGDVCARVVEVDGNRITLDVCGVRQTVRRRQISEGVGEWV